LDVNKIIDSFLSIDPKFIIIALSFTLPKILLYGISWKVLLDEQRIKLSYIQTVKIYLIGVFYGSFTPGFLGHLIRAPYVKEKTNEPYGKIFVNMYMEVALRTIALLLMIIIGTLLIIGTNPELFIFSIVIFIMTLAIYIYIINKERGERLFNFLIRYLIPKKFKDHLFNFIRTFYNDFPRLRILAFPLIIGFFIWLITFTQVYLMAMALDLNIPYYFFLVLFPIANIAGYLPITFGGLGTREFTSILIFTTLFDVLGEDVLVFTLMGFIITDITMAIIGFFLSLTETKKHISSIETLMQK
jgi:uncharacterized protein (TIRG00374 family)